jgi:hypothetical protein
MALRRMGKVTKFLVIPEGEAVPHDFRNAISALGIKVRRFKLVGSARKRAIELISGRKQSPNMSSTVAQRQHSRGITNEVEGNLKTAVA